MSGFIEIIVSYLMGLLPQELEQFLKRHSKKLFSFILRTNNSIIINQYNPNNLNKRNEIFDCVQAYLMRPQLLSSVQILQYSKTEEMENPTFALDFNQDVQDNFQDIPLEWSLSQFEVRTNENTKVQVPRFKLSFHKDHKESIQSEYLQYVTAKGAETIAENRKRKIYSNNDNRKRFGTLWSGSPFSHPSNFDTLALNQDKKDEIKADLRHFVSRKEFYTRVGRAWKRGYLLYGPPGTGKTSLIAAIANFLQFDIYDLELALVMDNVELRTLLRATSSKSVIVVEDVDCSLHLLDRKEKRKVNEEERFSTVSLSGVFNFVDGLWSSGVGERLMIFTTNHKENIDPTLLRVGRMDKHIELRSCGFEAFKILAKNYLGIDDHELMEEVGQVLPGAEITPADVAEFFLSCGLDVELGMNTALEKMKKKEMEGKEDATAKRRRRRR